MFHFLERWLSLNKRLDVISVDLDKTSKELDKRFDVLLKRAYAMNRLELSGQDAKWSAIAANNGHPTISQANKMAIPRWLDKLIRIIIIILERQKKQGETIQLLAESVSNLQKAANINEVRDVETMKKIDALAAEEVEQDDAIEKALSELLGEKDEPTA